jgi:Putative beta-barrel porin 2
MTGRLVLWGACVAAAVVVGIAQSNVDQAENPPVVDESRPTAVMTPTSDSEANEAAQPLVPQASGDVWHGKPATTIQPETVGPAEEAEASDQVTIPPEPRRKLWRISPLFSVGVYYDDNIFLTNTNRVADVIWTISAGFAFELGDFRSSTENYLTFQWVGIPVLYTNNPEQNQFNQSASLSAQYRWAKLVGQLESSFNVTTGGNREVNTITTTRTISNALRFKYDYSGKTGFDAEFSQLSTSSSSTSDTPLQTNNQYESKFGMNYQIFPKTSVGIEARGGVLDQPSNPLQYYQQVRFRTYYAATGKLSFKLSAGAEAREFAGNNDVKISPVFSLGLDYNPFDGTNFSLIGYRNIVGSASIAGQDVTATGFEISASQRFFQKFIAGISFGYENDAYFDNGVESPTNESNRVDNFIYVRPRLSYSVARWFTASVFYAYRRQVSNQATNSFYDNQVGMEIAAKF